MNNRNVESEIDSKFVENWSYDKHNQRYITNDAAVSQLALLEVSLNATAFDNTVATTNALTDPTIIGELNYKETASDTDVRNLISEISSKAYVNSPNFSNSLQLISTNVLLQAGDFNGTL